MPINRTALQALFFLLAVITAATAGAQTNYWRITSDHITVISNGNGERCTRLAATFSALERILRQLADWDSSYELPPIAVYAIAQQDARRVFLTDSELKRQVTDNYRIYSKYLPGDDFNVAAIVDIGGIYDPLQSVLLLYAEGILTQGPTMHDPSWYQMGIANLLNGLIIRSDGSILLNRNMPFEPVDSGKRAPQGTYDLARLLQSGPADLNGGGDFKSFVATAREWAQFGLLTTDQHRSQYHELAVLMRQGVPAEEAVKQAFGTSLEQLTTEFAQARWRYQVQFRLPPTDPGKPLPAPMRLEPGEAEKLLQVLAARAQREGPGQT
jgi:hypothetical protein